MDGSPRPRVLAVEWLDPVFVAGHWTPQLIELAGGEDVMGFAGEPSQEFEWETLAAAQPEIVVVMPCGYDAPRAHAEALAFSEQLAGLQARRVTAVDAAAYFSRPGPRLIDGAGAAGPHPAPAELPPVSAARRPGARGRAHGSRLRRIMVRSRAATTAPRPFGLARVGHGDRAREAATPIAAQLTRAST